MTPGDAEAVVAVLANGIIPADDRDAGAVAVAAGAYLIAATAV